MGDDEFYFDAWNNTVGDGGLPTSDSSGNSASGLNLTSLAGPLNFLGMGMNVFGEYEQGKQKAGAYHYNADLAMQEGEIGIMQLENEEPILAGTQKAIYSKAGVTLSGSPLDVMLESNRQIQLDKQIVKYNAESKANMLNYEADVAKNNAKMSMAKSLITGGLGFFGL